MNLVKGKLSILFTDKLISETQISVLYHCIAESWGMANDGEWQKMQYLVEGVKSLNDFTLEC